MTTVAQQVIALCEQQSGREASPESRLVEDLDLDSLDRIELAMVVENQFCIEIPDRDVDRKELGVVSGLIEYVERKLPRYAEVAPAAGSRPGAEL